MKKTTYWQDGNFWIGYINDYPEYGIQGLTFDELIENLKDIYYDIKNELMPGKRKSMDLGFDRNFCINKNKNDHI